MTAVPARCSVAVASGKGGVGKSTVSLNLAVALAEGGARVGLLDVDVYGPDIPLMINLKRSERLARWDLWRRGGVLLEPVERFGLKVMSAGFLLAEEQALTMPAPLLGGVVRQLVHDVAWGELDYLVVDLPPGTADLQQVVIAELPLAGALVVVGPQDAAHLDALKLLELLRDGGVRILGGIENMSGLDCPHCGKRVDVFPRVAEERSIWARGVELLGSVPLDPELALPGPHPGPFRSIAQRVAAALE